MAEWDLTAQLLRVIELDLRGIQWQNAKKGTQRPKPIPLPEKKPAARPAGPDLGQRLRNLGYIPADVKG